MTRGGEAAGQPPHGNRRRHAGHGPAAAVLLLLAVAACGGDTAPAPSDQAPHDRETPLVPALRRAPAEPEIVADLFPPTGSRGLVLNHCSTCHSPACAIVGQRSRAEWAMVEASHIPYGEGLSAEDRGKIFEYLRRHFNDTLPEPAVPPRFLQGGCDPG